VQQQARMPARMSLPPLILHRFCDILRASQPSPHFTP
jgi:hypothetical protein